MKNSVNLNSTEWCDLVFENKNKAYGAYALRQSSGKRHILAFGVVVLLMAIVSVLPMLINSVKATIKSRGPAPSETIKLTEFKPDEPKVEDIQREIAPPPVPVKPTFQYLPPMIDDDENVPDDENIPTQDDALNDPRQISFTTVEGEGNIGVDPDELNRNNQIADIAPAVPDKPFVTVEQMPQFPGGEAEMQKFIANTLKYPVVAQENGIEGRVTIRFVVTANGDISDVQIIRGIDSSCDKEAVRVVNAMPQWIPGKQNGRNVPVYFTLPIVYRLRSR